MAAAGFTPIQLYRTTTPAAQPLAANLADGELAINTADKKLYAKDSAGAVFLLADASSGGTTATNLAGGAAGSLPYQSGANATVFRAIGTAGQVLQVNSGATAPEWVSSSGTGNVARVTSPSFTTPSLGAATALSINSLTITTSTGTFTLANGKTLTVNNSLTLNGTDATVMTFPSTSATIARTDAAQTFTGVQTFGSNPIFNAGNANGLLYLNASKAATSSATITSDGTNIQLGAQGDMRFADADSSNWVAFQAPSVVASNVTWTLPAADGTTNQSLVTNGSGALSWASVNSPGGSNQQVQFNDSGTFGGDADFTWDKTGNVLNVNGSVYANYIYAGNIANVGSFTWNTATSSPAAASSVGGRVITPIHTGMRRCVVNDSGVVQYYLDPADSTLKADGTAADLTGGDGQVMVEIPAFYTKREVSGTFITWYVSPIALPGYSLHPAFTKDGSAVAFRYYGAYDACVYDDSAAAYISGLNYDDNISPNGVAVDSAADKLASVSGVYPMVGLTRAQFRTIAANRGAGWRQLDYTLFSAVQLLYLIEYQSFYSQNILGAGNTATSYAASSGTQSDNGGSEAGKSNSIGNASTNTTNGASSA